MVWGELSATQVSEFAVTVLNMQALQNNMSLLIMSSNGGRVSFHQDNVPCHASLTSRSSFLYRVIDILDWLVDNLDLQDSSNL